MTKTQLTEILEIAKNGERKHIARLYTCNAHAYEINYNGVTVVVLKSYNTFVAAFPMATWAYGVYTDGFYSNTTSSHIHKFAKWVCEEYGFDTMPVTKMYRHSAMSQKAYAENVKTDWAYA